MRIRALSKRILKQIVHDKRTLGLMLIVPLVLLTLIYFIFEGTVSEVRVGVTSPISEELSARIETADLTLVDYSSFDDALDALQNRDIAAIFTFENDSLDVLIDGANAGSAARVNAALKMSRLIIVGEIPVEYNIEYLDGIEDISSFDQFGATLIGFIIFFFVFLVAGMAFIKEKKSGTIEKLISTPIKRWEIVCGYIGGFGVITIIQAAIISIFVIKVLKIMMVGSIWYLLLITLLAAICALTLGMLLSTAANSEFQMMQFIPIVVIPQLFFSGLFNLSEGWILFGKIMPLTYIADALNKIMFRNAGIGQLYIDILILVGFSLVFAIINIQLLKRYRKV